MGGTDRREVRGGPGGCPSLFIRTVDRHAGAAGVRVERRDGSPHAAGSGRACGGESHSRSRRRRRIRISVCPAGPAAVRRFSGIAALPLTDRSSRSNRFTQTCYAPSMSPDRRRPFQRFIKTEAAGGVLLLLSAAAALIAANSPWAGAYEHLWSIPFGVTLPDHAVSMTLH